MRLAALAAEIDRRLAAAAPPGVRTGLTAEVLRHLAVEHLHHHDEYARHAPGRTGRTHWNLWVSRDGEPTGVFALLAFGPTGVEFLCGAAPKGRMHQFLHDRELPDPPALYDLLRGEFPVPAGPLHIDRPTAEAWLGRPRPW